MRRTVFHSLVLCLALAAPAVAQDAATTDAAPAPAPAPAPVETTGPGAVSQFMAAQDLFAIGRAQKDPLAVLAAARLAARIVANDVDRASDPVAETLPPSHPDAATMFTAAKAIAGDDDAMADLVARSEAEAPRLPTRTLLRTTRGIAAQASQTYSIAFFAAALAEVALLGDGKANLDLSVSAGDQPICLDTNPADRALCAFALTENATVTITVTNRSDIAASYSLLTN